MSDRYNDGSDDAENVPRYTLADDFSCDPAKWSWSKLCMERKNGMPAVVQEYERRLK